MIDCIQLDGSEGEGGGQILRTALSLSLITGQPFRIDRLRANRHPQGLRPQHLACVRGAEAISRSRAEGASVGAKTLEFSPGPVSPGEYLLEVGTAGSTPLLFQCLFFPLALAPGESTVTFRGGTHLPRSPSYHYLSWVWLPAMNAYALSAQLQLLYAGFYPEGGGEWRARVRPHGEPPRRVDLPARGTLQEMDVTSFVAGLPFEIADRQGRAAIGGLRERGIHGTLENLPLPCTSSRGSVVFIRAQFENTIAGFTALGEKGKRAEEVAREAVEQVARFMESGGALDEHLADQLLLPAALLAAGRLGHEPPGETRYTTACVTSHLRTNARVIERFLPVRVEILPEGTVLVRRRS